MAYTIIPPTQHFPALLYPPTFMFLHLSYVYLYSPPLNIQYYRFTSELPPGPVHETCGVTQTLATQQC